MSGFFFLSACLQHTHTHVCRTVSQELARGGVGRRRAVCGGSVVGEAGAHWTPRESESRMNQKSALKKGVAFSEGVPLIWEEQGDTFLAPDTLDTSRFEFPRAAPLSPPPAPSLGAPPALDRRSPLAHTCPSMSCALLFEEAAASGSLTGASGNVGRFFWACFGEQWRLLVAAAALLPPPEHLVTA